MFRQIRKSTPLPPSTDERQTLRLRQVNLQRRIYNLHSNNETDAILAIIKDQPLNLLITLIDDLTIKIYLDHQDLQSHWDKELTSHNLQPHPIIPSLHLLIGDYFFHQACIIESSEEKTKYLLQAEKYGCFNAILKLNNDMYDTFNDPETPDRDLLIRKMLHRMWRLAKLHGTPGFIHLAKTCIHIGHYWKKLGELNAASASYAQALQHLYTANTLLPYSAAIIHNAYDGQGLSASNAWRFDNIDAVIKMILTTYPRSLTQITQQLAQQDSDSVVRKLRPMLAGGSNPSQHLAACTL